MFGGRRSLSLGCQITLFSVKINFPRQRKRKEGVKMKPRPDLLTVLARLSSWMVILLLGTVIDLSVLARVTFPSDESLKVDLPEWQPADRATRQAQWKHSRPKYGHNRRGPYHHHHHHHPTLNTLNLLDMESMDKCPEFQLMSPCQCRERSSGLDITCENVETAQLKAVTENMKEYKEKQDFTVS